MAAGRCSAARTSSSATRTGAITFCSTSISTVITARAWAPAIKRAGQRWWRNCCSRAGNRWAQARAICLPAPSPTGSGPTQSPCWSSRASIISWRHRKLVCLSLANESARSTRPGRAARPRTPSVPVTSKPLLIATLVALRSPTKIRSACTDSGCVIAARSPAHSAGSSRMVVGIISTQGGRFVAQSRIITGAAW